MKTKIKLMIFTSFVLLLVWMATGCLTRTELKQNAEKKVQVNEAKQETNRLAQVRMGVGLTQAGRHAVELGLHEFPADSPFARYANVTLSVLDTGLLAFQAGDAMPESSVTLKYQKMVDDLLSTNEVLRVQGSNNLARVQAQLSLTEKRAIQLEGENATLKEKLEKVNAENAAMATTWSRITHIFWWAVWITAGVFAFRIIGAFVPPPYNSVFYIVDHFAGGVVRFIFKLLPQATHAAGVVGKDAFNAVVKGIGNARAELQSAASHADDKNLSPSSALAVLDSNLKEATEVGQTAVRPLIDQARLAMNV